MESKFTYKSKEISLERYPKTSDKSLRAWSNAELLVLDYIKDAEVDTIHVFNDRFGVWNCTLKNKKLTTVWTYASQQTAILQNLELNNLPTEINFKTPLDDLEKVVLALIKIPKSLELFELFLSQIYKASVENTEVVCGFMTKYFSPSYLKIAEQYFEVVEQSRAWKKARLLILKQPKKEILSKSYINTIKWKKTELQQYFGVFSSGKVDIGTQFLLENLSIREDEKSLLDLASGNGIIAHHILENHPDKSLTLVDDFNLAIASSKLNITKPDTSFYCSNTLEGIPNKTFDLVVSNPPFHFEHENNIEVALELFKDVKRVLKDNGRFVLVANKHLNYKTHLNELFKNVFIEESNKKFEIISCSYTV